MKKFVLLSALFAFPSVFAMELTTMAGPADAELANLIPDSWVKQDDKKEDHIVIYIPDDEESLEGSEKGDKNKKPSLVKEALIACASAGSAIVLNNVSPASAFLAYGAFGTSFKMLMFKLPTPAKVGVTLALIAAGYTLDKVVCPHFLGMSNVGFLPLGLTSSIMFVKKIIKDSSKPKKEDKAALNYFLK